MTLRNLVVTVFLSFFLGFGPFLNTIRASLVDPENITVMHFDCGFDEAAGLQPNNPSINCGNYTGAQIFFNPSGSLLQTDGSGNLVIPPGSQANAPATYYIRTHGGSWPGINQATLSAGTEIAVFELKFIYDPSSSPALVLHPRGSFFAMDLTQDHNSDPLAQDAQTGSIFLGTGPSQIWSSGRTNDFAPGNWVFRGEQSTASFTDGVKAAVRILIDPNQDGPNGSSTMTRLFEVNPDIDGSGEWTELVPTGPNADRIRSQDRMTGCCDENTISIGPPGGAHLHLRINNHDHNSGGANLRIDRLRVYQVSMINVGPTSTPMPTSSPTPTPTATPMPTPTPDVFDYSSVSIQGLVQNSVGLPIVGSHEYRIRFFSAESGGIQIGNNINGSVTLTVEGRFNIPVSPPLAIHESIRVWYELYLDTNDNGIDTEDLFSERIRVYSVPFSQWAEEATSMNWDNIKNIPDGFSDGIDDTLGSGSELTGVHDVRNFGAVADGRFITSASISAGSQDLFSSSSSFVAGDVGKVIVVANAGVSGTNLVSTISGFVSASHVRLVNAASSNAVGATAQWGTDNTQAINAAISGLTAGGTVWLGPGYFLVSSINVTDFDSINLVGAAWGINGPDRGTVLVPINGSYPVLDLTGSGGVKIENLQIGTTRSPVTGRAGILSAQIAGDGGSSLITLERVFITGSWSSAALYVFGIGDSSIFDCSFWNYNDSKYPMYFGRDNIDNITSRYQTVATGSVPCGNWYIAKFEAHNFRPQGPSTGSAIRLRGVGAMHFVAGLIDSSSIHGNISAEVSSNGTPSGHTTFTGCTFYTEGDTRPVHSINVLGGTFEGVTIIHPRFTTSGSIVNGSITYEDYFSSP